MTDTFNATPNPVPPNAIAVIGMAGRFPGANTVNEYWRNLCRGEESIVTLSESALRAEGIDDKTLANPAYVRRAALFDGIDEFDADFFGFNPQVARMTDPQHRLFLQTAFHAMEDAGFDPYDDDGATTVGVYGTSSASGYLLHNLMSHRDPYQVIGEGATFEMINLSLQNDKDHLATKAAHQFNLRGPALSVQTACSSSLVAVHLACQAILSGECELALAGGASLRVPNPVGYWYEPGTMVSASGHCRPFDVRSDGTVFGSGVGVVVLKALADAIADGDRIHAVIRGSAINNDGATKMTYAAPNAVGQADVIAEAHAVAEVDAATIGYIESHGTGTPLGDPIEIDGLRQAFEVSTTERTEPCYIGSVKANIGHLEVASGIAGLIKTILCLKHRTLPATLHYTAPNPELHLERGPFKIRAEHGPWESAGVRRAGVSSFGVGGTNAHVVLEEAPTAAAPAAPAGPQVLLLSARTEAALAKGAADLAAELAEPDAPALADVAVTLAGRRTEPQRLAVVAADAAAAATALAAPGHDAVFTGAAPEFGDAPRVALLFPGQGAQHAGMARGLYDAEPVFAAHFDAAVALFDAELGIDLRTEIFDGTNRSLERTDRAQPALFCVQYALAKLLESYGVQAAAMAGHSIGEYTAATLAGVFDLPTAVKAVSMRARLMHTAARGVMVAVPLSPAEVAEHLGDDVDVATVNDPGSCVVAGTEAAITAFSDRLAAAGVAARRVRTSHAFHSRLMDPVIAEYQALLAQLPLREPTVPLLSNVTGTWLSAAEATDPATWARQIRSTVRFADELGELLAQPDRVVIEVGPGGALTSSATRHPAWAAGHRAVRLMRHHAQNRPDHDTFLLALGQLWAAGVAVDFTGRTGAGRQLTLPGYPFEPQRHWIDYNAERAAATGWRGGAPVAADGAAGAAAPAPADGQSPMQATVTRIFGQCLGLDRVDPAANFFDLGGDSLIAISVAMTATHEGLELTPQDIYDNPTVSALAAMLTERYTAGGLARPAAAGDHPPVPPNLTGLYEDGLTEPSRWRIPLLLRLRADVGADDVAAVLGALTDHHEALRLQISHRDGLVDQHIGQPGGFDALTVQQVPAGADGRTAALAALTELAGDPAAPALSAVLVPGDPGWLALSVHAGVADPTSRDILLTDFFTALGQRIGGTDIELAPVPTSWRDWSARCAALATHPAVLDSREHWLATASAQTLRIAEPAPATGPAASDLARVAAALTVAQTTEVDDARRRLRAPIDELLLAALARTVAYRAGAGRVSVDVDGPGRSVLKPDVDLHRTIGWLTTVYPVVLECAAAADPSAQQLVAAVHDTLKAVPHYGIGYGLLRHVYAPTARQLAKAAPADIHFVNAGAIPELPAVDLGDPPAQFDADTALAVREPLAGLGHALELRVYRSGGVLHLDFWHDTRRVAAPVAAELAKEYTAALLELARAAIAEDEMESANDDLTLVDLSAAEV